MVDTTSWQDVTANKIDTWSSTSMKTFLKDEAERLRHQFLDSILPNVPGISVAVDEWSDRQLIPWMGITVTTVDYNFEFKIFSPGMQYISDNPTGNNLQIWLLQQLDRFNIKPMDVSSICTDNASNISKAISTEASLSSVHNYCICHLINIAVKRATGVTHQTSDDEANASKSTPDVEANASKASPEENSARKPKASKHWYYEEVNSDEDESDTPEPLSRRNRVPTQKLAEYLSELVENDEYNDCVDETETVSDAEAMIAAMWPGFTKLQPSKDALTVVTTLTRRCHDIVKHVHTHSASKRALDQAIDAVYSAAMEKYQYELYKFQKEQESHQSEKQPPEQPKRARGLVMDVATRWNSLLSCICSVIENCDQLTMIWDKYGDGQPMFEEEQWETLEAIAAYLVRFDDLTIQIQGDQILASEALLVVKAFKDLLTDTSEDADCIIALKRSMRNHLTTHKAKLSRILTYLSPDSLAAYCALVDPRACKSLGTFFLANEREKLRSNFKEYGVDIVTKWQNRSARLQGCTTTSTNNDSHPPNRLAEDTAKNGTAVFAPKRSKINEPKIFSPTKFAPSRDESSSSEESDIIMSQKEQMKQQIEAELRLFTSKSATFDAFLQSSGATTKLEETNAIFLWWKQNASDYPLLRIIAATLYSVRVTSASAERLFSMTGLLRTSLRNRMSASLFDALVCYAYNDKALQRQRRDKFEKRNK